MVVNAVAVTETAEPALTYCDAFGVDDSWWVSVAGDGDLNDVNAAIFGASNDELSLSYRLVKLIAESKLIGSFPFMAMAQSRSPFLMLIFWLLKLIFSATSTLHYLRLHFNPIYDGRTDFSKCLNSTFSFIMASSSSDTDWRLYRAIKIEKRKNKRKCWIN